jgi:3-dehydroquinate dehydratase-1
MATRLQAYEPVPAMTKPNGVMKIEEIIHAEPPRLLVLFDEGQENILHVIADVVGQPFLALTAPEELANRQEDVVLGLSNQRVSDPKALHAAHRTIITTHCLDAGDLRDEGRNDVALRLRVPLQPKAFSKA